MANENEEKGDHKKEFKIIVNAEQKIVHTETLSFTDVVSLAFNPVPTGPNVGFTVTYRKAEGPKADGTLVEGQSVEIKNGTIFNVSQTDKS